MSAFVSNGKLYLNGVVGEWLGPFDCFTYEQVMMALDTLDTSKKIVVHVNSPGGDANEGGAIYSALTSLANGVDIVVEGIAASAGSLIAMAGKTITMTASSVMMIHDCWGFTDGNSDDHKRAIGHLEAMSNMYAGIYASVSKKSVAACRALMKAETWFEPQDAVTAGFATKVGKAPAGIFAAAFPYSQFQHAPKRLLDLAKAKDWKPEITPPEPSKEKTMTQPTPATARAEAAARIKAILTHAEAKDRGDLAEHLALETDMEPEAAIGILAKAGKSSNPGTQTMSYEERRLSAAALSAPRLVSPSSGLAMPNSGSGGQTSGGIVANMKRRHGIKEGN